MTDDLIKRLRDGVVEHAKRWTGDTHDDMGGSADYDATEAVMAEAAAALVEARAEIARLRKALERAAEICDTYRDSSTPGGMQALADTLGRSIRALAPPAAPNGGDTHG